MKNRVPVLRAGCFFFAAAWLCSGCAPEARSASPERVRVYRYAGAVQCGSGGVAPEVMAETLAKNGVSVLSFSCAHDGRGRIAVCGAETGLINVYEIDARDLGKALALGFSELRELPDQRSVPCHR